MPRISVCLVTYKNRELTDVCIESINKCSYPDIEILVWDNSVINLGLAKAHNKLAQDATGEYLFFLNNDTLVKHDIFEWLLESPFSITGCKRYDYTGETELESWFSVDKFGFPAGQIGPVFYPDGALFMHKSVWKKLGGFDEQTFMYGEDRDFCWRAWIHGFIVGINYNAIFYHNTHSALGEANVTRRYHSEKNTIRYMIKNSKSLSILLEYSLWSILELLIVLFKNPSFIIKCYIPAYWWNLKNLKDTLAERKKLHRVSTPPFSKVIGKLYALKKGLIKWG